VLEPQVRARSDSSGHQTIDVVVHRGYQPDSIRALAGVPLRVVFRREDDDACSERVVFSAPRLDRNLAARGATIVDLPAQPPGEIRFTCGMGRYRGRIELVDERRVPVLTRLRRRATLLEARLGTALVFWICSLPLIALIAVVALDPGSAIAAVGAALAASVVGCVWAFRRSARPT
jgi:Uncharacterized protein conserved in bacteria